MKPRSRAPRASPTRVIAVVALLTLWSVSAEGSSGAGAEAASFPPPLDAYHDEDLEGIGAVL